MPLNVRRATVVVLVAVLVLLLAIPALVGLYTDWLWFQELHFERIFTQQLTTQIALFAGAGLLVFVVLYANLRLAQRGLVPDPILIRFNPNVPHLNVTSLLRRLAIPAALVLAFLTALPLTTNWLALLQFLHRTPFGVADPIFGRDIGYYVFVLPVVGTALGLVLALLFLSLFLTVPLYWLRGDVVIRGRQVRVEPAAGRHLGILIALVFLALGAQTWFVHIPSLLFSTTGPMVGASYADLHAALPALRLSAVVALIAAGYVLLGAIRQTVAWNTALAIAAYVVIVVVGRGIVPGAVQKFFVDPTELTREAPYLAHHIEATRRAWDLDSVETLDLTGGSQLTRDDIAANAPTIENVRLWDRDPLLQTFGQLQEIRTYYDFVSVDDDRYWIDGKYRQVMLSPRELNPASLPTRTFINEHLTFTHGMGVTLGPVNQVTEEGLPVLFIKDLPPSSNVSLKVVQPRIYFGELPQQYVFVNTRQQEFDYPSGETNVFTAYEGSAGVPIGSVLRRGLLAWRFRSMKILLSQDLTADSRILYYRNIMNRTQRALPFLRLDRDPYLVITDVGELKWILDGYTVSARYPYSQRLADGSSYMRNSVKVVLDAYNGDITPYVAEPNDPLIQTFDRIFPGIFQPLEELPSDLRAHLRYPEDLYQVQAALYTTYHMDEPEAFYHREDQWQIPVVDQRDRPDPFMRHIIMRLPEEEEAEFIFMTPFTPRGKDNLAAWMVARNDGPHYGKLRVYRFPRQSLVFGPRQIVNRINQDTEISRQTSLWDQRGSQVIRGELLVIPIEASLIYVQPLYLRAEGGRIPELKRVVVAYQNQVVMEETLDQALGVLFGASGPAVPAELPAAAAAAGAAPETAIRATGTASLIRRANDHYTRAIDAQRAGDWAAYGEAIRRLGEVLEELRRATGAGP
ncbi:MAG: UPF0182 family protein [Gemmatimonadales bacterium]|nr:UPF0182 family protein [Gemmatimonadales bacterium]